MYRQKIQGITQCSKFGKKCNVKSTKTHFLLFQKWQKINFCTRRKFITTKNIFFFSPKIAFLVVLNFFLVQKWIFCHFWNSKKCVYVLLKLHFFLILEHYAAGKYSFITRHLFSEDMGLRQVEKGFSSFFTISKMAKNTFLH